jgi:hypothetical protein
MQYYVFKSLRQFEQALPAGFFRCHRSTIVNMTYIQKIDKRAIYLTTGSILPVSRSKIHLLKNKLANLEALIVPLCHHCEDCSEIADCRIIRPFMLD